VDWQLPIGPVSNVVATLERHGIVVMRLPLGSADVDAFSLPFRDRPIVVLGAEKNDRARSRFDAAHELGHLVMHGEQLWGLPDVERQAHRFAAAFLMPEQDIAGELPDRVDWPRLFELKRQWQVSLAALLMRARTLGRIRESDYVAAVKMASMRGWRRVEPVPLGPPEQPTLLKRLLESPGSGDCRRWLPKLVVDQLERALAT
jgi:Zn-dependent peptidase ImmA (M78 family)